MLNLYIFSSADAASVFECIEKDPEGGIGSHYPVPMSLHYIPESWKDTEMMKVALSWGNPDLYYRDFRKAGYAVCNGDLLSFRYDLLSRVKLGGKIIVVHGQDANSLLLLYTITSTIDTEIYHIDVTPEGFSPKLRDTTDNDWVDIHSEDEGVRQYDPVVYRAEDVTREQAESFLGTEKLVTPEEREAWREIWNHWGGEDARDFPILVDQNGNLFHPYNVYLNSSIFNHTPTEAPVAIRTIAEAVSKDHPQVELDLIVSHIVKMADQRQIKWTHKAERPEDCEVIQYRTDIATRWNRFQDMHYLMQFAEYAGKTITLSEEDIEAELERDEQDSKDLWGKGHLHREARQQARDERDQRMLVKWAGALNEDWGWYHLLAVMKTKLEMMVDYMRNWSPIANGRVYADQMERAIALIDIVIAWGGQYDYPHSEDEDDYFDTAHFAHYVNLRNQDKYPAPVYDGHHFWCESQRVRFTKAWNILWEMLRTKLITWED